MNDNIPNIIKQDGVALYYAKAIPAEQLSHYYLELFNKISWEQEIVMMFGKEITPKRKEICLLKFVCIAIDLLVGEKNGSVVGRK